MRKYERTCVQCGGILKGYFQFSTCSECYSMNIQENQQKLLLEEKQGVFKMTNQLTQAELIEIAKQAGFKETVWSNIVGAHVESLAKFAQLIQQRTKEEDKLEHFIKDIETVLGLSYAAGVGYGTYLEVVEADDLRELLDRYKKE